MNPVRCLSLLVFLLCAVSSLPAKDEPPRWVADLSSEDGQKRIAATRTAFEKGKDALEPLRAAGAKQISPYGQVATRRIDMVYSLLDGLKPNPPGGRAGYVGDSFGIHVAKGCAREDVVKLGAKYGFAITGPFNADGVPTCYVRLTGGKGLVEVIKALLMNEPQVVSATLNYFEK